MGAVDGGHLPDRAADVQRLGFSDGVQHAGHLHRRGPEILRARLPGEGAREAHEGGLMIFGVLARRWGRKGKYLLKKKTKKNKKQKTKNKKQKTKNKTKKQKQKQKQK